MKKQVGFVKLLVADDGKGFDMHAMRTGIGFENMKRRAEICKGKFICTSSLGQGCKILITIPLDKEIWFIK